MSFPDSHLLSQITEIVVGLLKRYLAGEDEVLDRPLRELLPSEFTLELELRAQREKTRRRFGG